jgi:hypothetical protein
MNLAQTNPYKDGKVCWCDIIFSAYFDILKIQFIGLIGTASIYRR